MTQTMSDDLVEQNLGLARMIAYEYANIPGASMDEVVAEAGAALAAAARAFDPRKGQFSSYASRAIRNALNSFFTRQLRYVKVHELTLDATTTTSTSAAGPKDHPDPGADVVLAARAAESRRILEELLAQLPPRSRLIVVRIREGMSYSEIGKELGISKQAVHKVAHAALQGLREKLEARGLSGIDSKGFLKSRGRSKRSG
jgi:RNA polymerase sigma factor (sigma-70 family)